LEAEFSAIRDVQLQLAIPMAGGMYYWWNDSLPFWGIGVLLTLTGLLVPLVSSRRIDSN